jgi:hypothetical protein
LNNKIEEILSAVKLSELMNKRDKGRDKNCICLYIFASIAMIASVSAIAYLIYKHLKPDYLEDFDDDDYDDLDDGLEDDLYEEDEVVDNTINNVTANPTTDEE